MALGLIAMVISCRPPTRLRQSTSWLLHAAGVSTLFAWSVLAWRSHAGGAPLATMLTTVAIAWAMLGVAAIVGRRASTRTVILWGVAFRVGALFADPVLEDDYHRFLWDGYRFAITGNPYSEPPAGSFTDTHVPPVFRAVLDEINHPDVPTIYGPVCQWAFRISYVIAPAQLWPWKLMLLCSDLVVIGCLLRQTDPLGRLVLAWCPLAIFETGFNAHPDALAIAFVIAAWRLAFSRRFHHAAVAVGLGMATKGFAVLLVPFFGREWPWRSGLLAAATAGALYLPFWLQGSSADLAGLRAMAVDWEFNSSAFAVLQLVFPWFARAGCALAFVLLWVGLFRWWVSRSRESMALPPGEWIYGAFLMLSATANPWYFLWAWPFVAVRRSAAGICALVAVSLCYITGSNLGRVDLGTFEHPWWVRPLEFGSILAALAWSLLRSRARRSET